MPHGMRHADAIGVVILAGGQAARLPRKLELDAGGLPLVVRVYSNLRAAGQVYVSADGAFPPAIDAMLECPIVIDRRPYRGPLAALFDTLPHVTQERVFVTAGDAPFVRAAVVDELASFWNEAAQAVVPVNARGKLEPLCALYDRAALLEAARRELCEGSGSVRTAVEHLRTIRVRLSDERAFASVNTPDQRRALLGV
jgi:molybdopterin-guanine dinucleotide biosynthesis protein A